MLISDINDHPPVIQQVDPVRVTVLEHSALGTLITVISAVDIFDFGANTHVVYEIISGNEDGIHRAYNIMVLSLIVLQATLLLTATLES